MNSFIWVILALAAFESAAKIFCVVTDYYPYGSKRSELVGAAIGIAIVIWAIGLLYVA